MCGGICGTAGEMSEGRCSVCYRPYRQCSCLLDSAARRQTKKKLAPMKKAIMSKDRIENGFDEKYGRPMTKKEKAKMNRGVLKKRVNKNRRLTKPLRGKKDHKGV